MSAQEIVTILQEEKEVEAKLADVRARKQALIDKAKSDPNAYIELFAVIEGAFRGSSETALVLAPKAGATMPKTGATAKGKGATYHTGARRGPGRPPKKQQRHKISADVIETVRSHPGRSRNEVVKSLGGKVHVYPTIRRLLDKKQLTENKEGGLFVA